MAEFKLGRIRFVWKGDWETGTQYLKDDVVTFNGKSYICVIGHTANDFIEDLNAVPSNWNLIANGQLWKDEWAPNTEYLPENIVKYGARLYIANTRHISAEDSSSGIESDIANWDVFAEGLDWKGEWQTSFDYKINDFVSYGGLSYVCLQDHISAADFDLGLEDDSEKWSLFNEGIDYKQDWQTNFRYKKNDVVKRGAKLWIATTPHISTDTFENDLANWEAFVEGFQYENEWDAYRKYETGDIVKYGGNQYIAISDNVSSFPITQTSEWEVFSEGLKFVGDWNEDSSLVEYRVGEVVRLGGFTYRCIKDHSNQQPPNTEFWERLNSGFDWRGEYVDGAEYYEGDVVRFGDNSYVANSYHIAENGVNSPDVADSTEFWSAIAIGSEQSVLTAKGDLVYFNGTSPVRLPVGETGQILTVNSDSLPEWQFLGSSEDVYYVADHGVDKPAPIYGTTLDKPFKSIRYACEQIEQGAKNPKSRELLELNRIFIQRETSEWIENQVENATAPFTSSFEFDTVKCERDIGFIVDSIIFDITHGGNVKSRKTALKYVTEASEFYTKGQEQETVAAINYALSLMQNVLEQTDPAENYQELQGDNSTRIVEQYKDPSIVAEDVYSQVQDLVSIITTAILDGTQSSIPAEIELHTLVRVSTGTYREVCPIIVPAKCCVMGDELRSTRVEARNTENSSLTPKSDFKYSFVGLDRVEQIISSVIEGGAVTPSANNPLTQFDSWPIVEVDYVSGQTRKLLRSIKRKIDFDLGTKTEVVFPRYYDMTDALAGRGRDLINLNREFIQAEVIAFIQNTFAIKYSRTKCKQDIGYVLDAISYDLTYGGNWQSVTVGEAYYEGNLGLLVLDPEDKQITIDTYNFLNNLTRDVATDTFVATLQSTVDQVRGTGGDAGTASAINALYTDIVNIVDNGSGTVSITYPSVSGTEENAVISALDSAKAAIEDDCITFVNANFPDLTYDTAKCERDVGLIIDAAKYDLSLNTKFASFVAAYAYLRKSGETVLAEQKEASLANFEFLRQRIQQEIPVGTEYDFARSSVDETIEILDDVLFAAKAEGNNDQVDFQEIYHATRQLELNKDFLAEEAVAFVDEHFQDTVTAIDTATNTLTVSDTSWLDLNMPVVFTDDSTDVTDAGLSQDITYYVHDIVSDTEFQIKTAEIDTTALDLTQAWDGSFTLQKAYAYDADLCKRDVRAYIDSVKWDLVYPANWERSYIGVAGVSDFTIYRPASYKHRLAARYYANSVIGSQEEDMYYLRNATGLRLQTVAGLQGDLGPENEFGTRRPTAGAYASLDPGWGPQDERVWIIARSPYVQNVSTFGRGAIGQKIDGDLHAGGNDSIVSNDFTQLISDGIGAWITNNGRAELVSVFSYYAHIGYLAENGGRIRATNGNNSYGNFGSVAEGVDVEETPVRAVVDNKTQFNATISNVYTDGSEILTLEYDHAGNNYTQAQIDVFGAGSGAETIADEFRDNAVFNIQITEDNEPAGGEGYTFASNVAQEGSLTGIFLAATDGRLSSAYPGMAIYIVGGAGAGQYATIDTYNAGSKEATVIKEDGTAGWEHVVPGKEIVAPNATSTYQIEPRVEFSAPPISSTEISIPNATYADIEFIESSKTFTGLTAIGGAGSGASFDVTKNGSKYYAALNQAGTGYTRLDELVIDGSNLNGASSTNDLTLTIIAVDNTGSILDFEVDGEGRVGYFFALPNAGQTAYTSTDGSSWNTTTLTTSTSWSDSEFGILDDGTSLFRPEVLVAIAENGTVNYTSNEGTTWNVGGSTGLPTTGAKKLAFGNVGLDNNRFVAISDNSQDVSYTVDGGINWTSVSSVLPSTGFNLLEFGKGIFVALAANTTNVAYSSDGVSWTTNTNIPDEPWVDLAWGNGRFVALSSNGVISYSLDGTEWSGTISTPINTARSIAHGQGIFVATDNSTGVLSYSEDGINWDQETGLSSTDYDLIAFGNPNRTGRFIGIGSGATTSAIDFRAGARARGRAGVSNQQIFEIRLLEPGSGYTSAPTVTVTDPTNTVDVSLNVRVGKGALANPSFVSRGTGYLTASAEINDENSNGEADFLQSVDQIAVKWLTERPVDGSNVEFSNLPGQFFKLVNTISFLGDNDGSYTAFLQISPGLDISQAPQDETEIELRIRFSQVRLTGHDFLDIGTGNFDESNYPTNVFGEPDNLPDQTKETTGSNGGRVFFTSTDQDGNFRVGDLFSVEQSTGVATISADAFNLAGLQELSLGEVTLGGNSATITEFSTDPFFTANSNNIIPTQRAVKAYIESQIGGGGASINVNSVTAGDIFVGGDQITSVSGDPINISGNIRFRGAVLGFPLAMQYFLR